MEYCSVLVFLWQSFNATFFNCWALKNIKDNYSPAKDKLKSTQTLCIVL